MAGNKFKRTVWLGAHVCIAEIDRHTGKDVAEHIVVEFGAGTASFVQTNVGSERSINRLAWRVLRRQPRIGSPYRMSCE